MDDVLNYGASVDHDQNLEDLLQGCRKQGIVLNKTKLRITELPFVGHVFSNQVLNIDTKEAKAVLEMPRPADVDGAQRLNSFVNYLTKFLSGRLAEHMELIRQLIWQDTMSTGRRNNSKDFKKSRDS